MRYSMKRILRNLCHSWLLYLLIAAHFMLGAGLFIICMNFRMTSRELLSESKKKSMESLIPVTEINGISEYGYGISYDTYLRLSTDEAYEDLEMLFTEMYGGAFGYFKSEDDGMMRNMDVYFMNDALFDELYHIPRKKDIIYVGKQAYDTLLVAAEMIKCKDDPSFFLYIQGEEMYIEGETLFVAGEAYSYEVVEDALMPTDDDPEYMPSMTYALIFPVEDAYDTMPHSGDGNPYRSFLFYRYRNADWRGDLISSQLREINEATTSTGYFIVQDEYKELKRQLDDFRYDMDRWMMAAVSVLLLAGVGCMGSMFLLLNKRRHLIAVSVAYGSTMRRITVETITETMIVLAAGGVLGIWISPQLRKLVLYQGELRMNVAGIGIVFAAAFLFSVLSVLAGMHEIKARNVAATLKEDA